MCMFSNMLASQRIILDSLICIVAHQIRIRLEYVILDFILVAFIVAINIIWITCQILSSSFSLHMSFHISHQLIVLLYGNFLFILMRFGVVPPRFLLGDCNVPKRPSQYGRSRSFLLFQIITPLVDVLYSYIGRPCKSAYCACMFFCPFV